MDGYCRWICLDNGDVSSYLLSMFKLSMISGNAKTGPIPVSTSSKDTCPNACPFKGNGCYAASGPLSIHWNKVTNGERGYDWATFLKEVRKIPRHSLFRLNQAGDLVGSNDVIDFGSLKELTNATKHCRPFTYTHYPLSSDNISSLRYANSNGLTINVSTNSVSEVDHAMDIGLPTVTVLPHDHDLSIRTVQTEKGRKVLVCPASLGKDITCAKCGLCQKNDRSYAIGFVAHGQMKKKVTAIASK